MVMASTFVSFELWCNQSFTRHDLDRGLPKLKFEKDHLCSACTMRKSKKKPHKPKSEDTNQEKLYLLYMDLYGPMRVASVNGKKCILVIVEYYSRFTWVKCLRSKDEAPDFIIKFLKMIQLWLKTPVRRIRTDNGTEFVNQTLSEYYDKVGISHETYVARSPQQNDVVERHNHTLIEVVRTIWTKDHPIANVIGDPCLSVSTRKQLQTDAMWFFFDAFPTSVEPKNFKQAMTEPSWIDAMLKVLELVPSGLVPNSPSSTSFVLPSRTDWDLLFQPLFDELLTPSPSVNHPAPELITLITEVVAPEPAASTSSPSSTTVDQDAPSP
nr:retrovirus-related Pol polyprotein from transposon TNT 1-94 [Tanacetum cinerariifolium]